MPAQPGIYGVSTPTRAFTFAPNITPISYGDSDLEDALLSNPDGQASVSRLFPPSETPAPPPTRRRCPPGKRPSQGYIPRPPNAFMLFRADFVRQKHVPGTIETSHTSLSKIIGAYPPLHHFLLHTYLLALPGTCWKQLPLEEKHIWEVKAKQAKAQHKLQFPDYRFRPVHNKNKNKEAQDQKRDMKKVPVNNDDERRCEEVAQLLLEGKKGEDLAKAIRALDRARSMEKEQLREQGDFELEDLTMPMSMTMPAPMQIPIQSNPQLPYPIANHAFAYPRRPSSVPLPNEWFATHAPINNIALPPFATFLSRPDSPVHSISRYTQANSAFEQFTNNTSSFPQYTPTNAEFPTTLFAPTPQAAQTQFSAFFNPQMQITPRSSLGHRRASSAQPLLMGRHSWLFDMPPPGLGGSNDTTHLPLPNFSSFDLAATMGNNDAAGLMERAPSPLPEVQSGLFGDFSFGGASSPAPSSTSRNSVSSASEVEAVPPHQQLSKLDTSIPPWLSSLTDASSTTPSSAGSSSSSSAGSPAPSVSDVLPEMSTMDMSSVAATPAHTDAEENFNMSSYMNLDGLYAPDSMEGMFDEAVGAGGGMGYEMYAGYEDPVVYSRKRSSQSQALFEMASA
ncbi:hypothetical protein D9613_004611 [Agrocybe pediades]|uniref:HMG box domain-containing protein n=1 Tax=Agrocybe pediades TaxID=84607 RepID=A0A8H4QJ97_9AGAR|nr:hypothetical protein D9613_004611 [Agrocybe pediades]